MMLTTQPQKHTQLLSAELLLVLNATTAKSMMMEDVMRKTTMVIEKKTRNKYDPAKDTNPEKRAKKLAYNNAYYQRSKAKKLAQAEANND